MSKVGHLFSRSSLSRAGDRLAQRYRARAAPKGCTRCRDMGDRPFILWGGGERRQGSVCSEYQKSTAVTLWRKFLDCAMIMSTLRGDSCLQGGGSEWHLCLLPFAKVSSAMNMLPCGLYQRASDPWTVFYSIVKHSLFEVKSNLVLQTWNSGFWGGNSNFRYISSDYNRECQ